MNASLSPEVTSLDGASSGSAPAVAILAGGLGTRLHPLTASTPKSMLMVAGEPFIAHQLRLLAQQGLCDVVVCGGHLMEQIEAFIGDGRRFGCRVRYSFDGAHLRGTGGAIRQALPLLGEQFFVLYGDGYLTAPFFAVLDTFTASGKPALMTILRNSGRWDTSNVEFAGGRIVRYDKSAAAKTMEHIDYGLSIFSAEVFDTWAETYAFGLAEVQQSLVAQQAMAAFEVHDRFYEIGSLHGLEETDRFLRTAATRPERRPDSTQPDETAAFSTGVTA